MESQSFPIKKSLLRKLLLQHETVAYVFKGKQTNQINYVIRSFSEYGKERGWS
jgi:hypothetical protein